MRQSDFDKEKWQCWLCPKGYERRAFDPVDGDRACVKRVAKGVGNKLEDAITREATYRGRVCEKGSFFDPRAGGECWKCPEGYKRTLNAVDKEEACRRPEYEDFRKATLDKRTPWPHECAKPGTFHDAWDRGACWSCPQGYRRTGYHINDTKACSKLIPHDTARAALVTQAQCLPGEIRDLKIGEKAQDVDAGGGCWKCPPEFQRTQLPIDGKRACMKEAGLDFEKAKFVADLTCPAAQHYDMIKITSADVSARPELKERKARGEPIKIDEPGTCWSCPVGYTRSTKNVKGKEACVSTGIEWYTAPYPEPGFFRLKGASDVLAEVTKSNSALVRSAIAAVGKQQVEQEKQLFVSQPHRSAAAMGMVFARLVAILNDESKASAADRLLVSSFRDYVMARRTYIAQDALDQYHAWKDWDRNRRGKNPDDKGPDYPLFTPQFTGLAVAGMAGSSAVGIAAGFMGPFGDVLGVAFGAAANRFDDFKQPDKAIGFLARAGAEYAIGVGLEKVATIVTAGAVGSAGPQIAIGVAIAVTSIMADVIITEVNVLPTLQGALATAKHDPNLKRLASTDAGMVELLTYWSYAMAGESQPPAEWLTAFAPVAKQASSAQSGP